MNTSLIVEGVQIRQFESAQQVFNEYLSKWSDIQDHLPMLRDSAKGRVLEIGVRSGVSTAALLTGVKKNGGHVWSIDIEPCNIFPNDPDWTFTRGDSFSMAIPSGVNFPINFDMVLIDGNHSYRNCLSDLGRFGILAPHILVHDVNAFEGVRNAVYKFLEIYKEYKLTIHTGSFGMAELTTSPKK